MLTDTDLTTIASKFDALKTNATASRGGTIASIAFTGAEVNLGAALAGFVNGRFRSPGKDHLSIVGMPADLLAGVLGIGASLIGTFGPLDTHVATISAGTLGGYAYRTAFAYGAAASEKATQAAIEAEQAAKAQLMQGNPNVVRLTKQQQSQVPQTVGAGV
jgi:hypothetical protein